MSQTTFLLRVAMAIVVFSTASCSAPLPEVAPQASATLAAPSAAPMEAQTATATAAATAAAMAMPALPPLAAATDTPDAAEHIPTPTTVATTPQTPVELQWISAEELRALLEEGAEIQVVDVQLLPEFEGRHIPGALNLAWQAELTSAKLLVRETPVVVYGNVPGEPYAEDVANQLIARFGFSEVVVLEGGLKRWREELGYPVEQSTNVCMH